MVETDVSFPHVDLGGYLLGTLTVRERADFEAHLADCPSCSHELEQLRRLPGLLGRAAEPVGVPAGLEARVLGAVAREPARRAAASRAIRLERPRRGPRWQPAWAGLAVAAAAAVFLGGIGLGRALVPGAPPGPAPQPALQTISLVAANGGAAAGAATIRSASGGRSIELTVQGLPPAPPGRFYTCWLVADDDTLQHQDRVSVGSFRTSDTGPVTLRWETAADPVRYPHLGVTLEPDNGSPLHQGPKVLAAATSPVTLLQVPLTAARGQAVALRAETTPGARCSLAVGYPSGPHPGAAPADAAGVVRWTWTVSSQTPPGTWPLQVRCGQASADSVITVS